MRVYISCDIEGVSGVIASPGQTSPEGKDYGTARELMTGEASAAVAGAIRAGATEIVVNDSHGPMTNLLIGRLHPGATLITGSPKPLSMMQGIDQGFDAAMFVGYHARAGGPGVLSHTISGAVVSNIWVNDTLVGETGINAGIAGYYGIPVVMVAGDDALGREVKALFPWVVTATVKWAINRTSARCLTPDKAQQVIEDAAADALRTLDRSKVWLPPAPVTFKLQTKDAGQAERAARMPYVEMVDDCTVSFTADDYITAFKGLRSMIVLAGR